MSADRGMPITTFDPSTTVFASGKLRTALNPYKRRILMQEFYIQSYLRKFNTSLNYNFGLFKDGIKRE